MKYILPFVFVFFFTLQAHADEPFEIGLVLPLTGPAADYGLAIRNSIELAQKDKPELFTNLRFHYQDAQYDPTTAITAMNKLIASDKVDLLVTWGLSFCKALAPIAESRKMPLIGICGDPKMGAGRHYALRFKNKNDEIMRAQAEYLNRQGVKRIGLLLADHPYLEEAMEALQRNLQPGQTLEIIDRLPSSEPDLRTNLLKLQNRRADFDAIGVLLYVGQISTFYRQAREMKIELNTFGSDFFESLSEVHASGGAMEGKVFASIKIKPDFIKRYKAAFHNESQLSFAAPAYEFAIVVGELFNAGGRKMSADEIMKSFSSVSFREGTASGPYKYVNDPLTGQYFQFPVTMKKISGDTFVDVE